MPVPAFLTHTLRPTETVRFEQRPLGFPPLTSRAVVLYAAILFLAAFPTLSGAAFTWAVRPKIVVPVPLMIPALLIIALIESLRFVAFRSRLYVVTNERVLAFSGTLRTHLRAQLDATRVRGVQLVGNEPAIATGERKLLLTGLDSVDLESVREALGGPPLLAPVQVERRRRWRRPLAALVALLVAAAAEGEGVLQRQGEREFQAVAAKVHQAVLDAEGAVCTRVAISTGLPVSRKCIESNVHNMFVSEARFHSRIAVPLHASGTDEIVSVETRCVRTMNVVPWPPSVSIRVESGRENATFLAELRRKLDAAHVEATWPRGVSER